MTADLLYRIAAVLLALGTLGHTFGGMLGTARKGPGSGPEADEVLARMKAVRFDWRGGRGRSWFDFWLGNGLGVSVLCVLGVVVLWTLGGLDAQTRSAVAPIAWATTASLAGLAALGFRYFAPPIGGVFALIAIVSGVAAAM